MKRTVSWVAGVTALQPNSRYASFELSELSVP